MNTIKKQKESKQRTYSAKILHAMELEQWQMEDSSP
jgi:hypothetical protein